MKSVGRVMVLLGLLALVGVGQLQAAFTSLYAFGDGGSTTTNNTSTATNLYYGKRFCNGRVWVEVLAQWQGLTYDSNKNWSYYGHYSENLKTNVATFTAPGDVATALFLVWVNNADFVDMIENPALQPRNNTKLSQWTNAMNLSLSNHTAAIQTLHGKGIRTLVMPNVVDLGKVPRYGLDSAERAFVRQRTVEFNSQFTGVLSNAMATLSGLTIHQPNIFSLLDNLITNAASFGMTNAGQGAVLDPNLTDLSLNGPGANYIFWDDLHPTAKFQMLIAERAQQLLSPISISKVTRQGTSNKLDLVNLPIGRNGFVDVSTNFLSWTNAATVTSTNQTQSVFVPAAAPRGFHRLRLPFEWIWP